MRLLPGKTIISDDFERKPVTRDNFLKYVYNEPISSIEGWTLRDLLEFIEPYGEIFGEMAWCHYDLFKKELDKPVVKDEFIDNIEFIEVKMMSSIDADGNINDYLDVCGINNTYTDEQIQEEYEKHGTTNLSNRYAIEFTPVNELAHIQIKVNDKYEIVKDIDKAPYREVVFSGKKPLYLIDVIWAILWEISFLGTPEDRDERSGELKKSIEDIELEESNTISFEDSMKRIRSHLEYNLDMTGPCGAD